MPQDSVFCGFCGAKVIPDNAASPDNSADQPVDPFGNPMQGQPINQAEPYYDSMQGQPPVNPTDSYGNPVPIDSYGNPIPTDPYGTPAPTDPYGNPVPTDPYGNTMQGQPPFNPMPGAYPPMGQPPLQEPEPKRYTWVWFVIPAVIGLAVLLFFLLKGSGDSSPGQTAATDSLKTEQPAVKDEVKDEPADTIGQQGAVQVRGNKQPPKQQEETREIVEDEEEDDDDDWRTPKSSSSKSEQGGL